jgi:hypothetical protein
VQECDIRRRGHPGCPLHLFSFMVHLHPAYTSLFANLHLLVLSFCTARPTPLFAGCVVELLARLLLLPRYPVSSSLSDTVADINDSFLPVQTSRTRNITRLDRPGLRTSHSPVHKHHIALFTNITSPCVQTLHRPVHKHHIALFTNITSTTHRAGLMSHPP